MRSLRHSTSKAVPRYIYAWCIQFAFGSLKIISVGLLVILLGEMRLNILISCPWLITVTLLCCHSLERPNFVFTLLQATDYFSQWFRRFKTGHSDLLTEPTPHTITSIHRHSGQEHVFETSSITNVPWASHSDYAKLKSYVCFVSSGLRNLSRLCFKMASRTCNRCWNADPRGVEELGDQLPRGGRGNVTEPTRSTRRGVEAMRSGRNV